MDDIAIGQYFKLYASDPNGIALDAGSSPISKEMSLVMKKEETMETTISVTNLTTLLTERIDQDTTSNALETKVSNAETYIATAL